MKNDVILLASGGMDSTVLAYKLMSEKVNVIPLFINYGQHCAEKELSTLKKLLPKEYILNLKIIDISDIYSESNSRMIKEANLWEDTVVSDDLYLPYRNLLFLSIASAYAQSINVTKVYSAFINSNHAKEIDCSLDFFNKLEILLTEYGTVKIEVPFRDLSKENVILLGLKLGVPVENTYSCQVNSCNPCGACPNCVDRISAYEKVLGK